MIVKRKSEKCPRGGCDPPSLIHLELIHTLGKGFVVLGISVSATLQSRAHTTAAATTVTSSLRLSPTSVPIPVSVPRPIRYANPLTCHIFSGISVQTGARLRIQAPAAMTPHSIRHERSLRISEPRTPGGTDRRRERDRAESILSWRYRRKHAVRSPESWHHTKVVADPVPRRAVF
jgi:hypothetical protein